MPRIKVVLNKTNTQKLQKFFKWAKKNWIEVNNEELQNFITDKIKNEIKNLKDCSEKMIVDTYIKHLQNQCPTNFNNIKDNWNNIQESSRKELAKIYTDKTFDNNIDIYFNEVKKEYILHPQNECDDLDFTPENRDIFIKNNLKLVVNCAKRYQNLGLPFEDLIQAGNEGLIAAFNKFKINKSNLREKIIEELHDSDKENYTYDEAIQMVKNYFTYGKLLDSTLNKIPKNGFDNKELFIEWCKTHIKGAVFASVAFQWIRASIIQELNKAGCIIKNKNGKSKKKKVNLDEDLNDFNLSFNEDDLDDKPKRRNKNEDYVNNDPYLDFCKGSNNEEDTAKIIRLDSINPYTDDNYSDADLATVANEEFIIEDQQIENTERQQLFVSTVETILAKLEPQERIIVKKKNGIGYPYQMRISEIAESENLSPNAVKRILRESMLILQESLSSEQKDTLLELL